MLQLPKYNAEDYTVLCRPPQEDFMKALEVVKAFIAAKGRILYGGTAIDHALKLKGGRLYADDAIPDLDFYSPNNIEDAYELADIFYKQGHTSARAIVGIHPTIMKVDIGGNQWVCDIAYFDSKLYDRLPTLTYQGMKSVDMLYQRIDMHSSLSFPFDNAPQEVIFDRWTKDTERFMLADAAYPITPRKLSDVGTRTSIPKKWLRSCVANGFLAFAIYCTALKSGDLAQARVETCPHDPTLLTFDTFADRCDFCAVDVDHMAKKMGLTETPVVRRQLMNCTPETLEVTTKVADCSPTVNIHSTSGRLLSVQTVSISCVKVRVVCIQYLLRWFLAMYFAGELLGGAPHLTGVYYAHYATLLEYVKANAGKKGNEILQLSVETYGNLNLNAPAKNTLNKIYSAFGEEERFRQPTNYSPQRANTDEQGNLVWPKVDYGTYHFYQEDGGVITS